MGTMLLNQIKKQASSFLQEKYKIAKMALTDVTEAELLAEEATSNVPLGPDARTMTKIAEASYDLDDYWRIVDVLHRRFDNTDWKQWRQSYKSLVLLEFLLTHGPEDFAEEFQCDTDIFQELETFQFIDEKGFNWGVHMQKRSEQVQDLLRGGETLTQARLKALKVTKEIQGFGSSMTSPTSSASPPSSSSSDASQTSSFGSYSTASSMWNDMTNELNNLEKSSPTNTDHEGLHLWDCPPVEETDVLIEPEDDENIKKDGLISGICSKLASISPLKRCDSEKLGYKSISDQVERVSKKKYDRQYSLGY